MKVLSGREVQVIKHAACGYTIKEIARIIGLEPRTIEKYVNNVKRKLLARNTTHAVYIASRERLLEEMN